MNKQILTNRPLFGARLNMAHPLTKGLVGCWLLNENGGMRAMDLSPYTNHGLVTGTTARWFGRRFNGSSDNIKCSTANWRINDSRGAIGIWFKPFTAVNECLFSSCDENTDYAYYMQFRMRADLMLESHQKNNDTADILQGALLVSLNKWHLAFFTSNGSSYTFSLDGITDTLTATTGANNGDWFADTPNRDNINIGALMQSTPAGFTNGIISLAYAYDRVPTDTEINQLYQSPYDMFLK